jgi:hypothetical protein
MDGLDSAVQFINQVLSMGDMFGGFGGKPPPPPPSSSGAGAGNGNGLPETTNSKIAKDQQQGKWVKLSGKVSSRGMATRIVLSFSCLWRGSHVTYRL